MGTAGDAPVKAPCFAAVIATILASTSCASLLRTDPFIRGTVVDVGDGWLNVPAEVPSSRVRFVSPAAISQRGENG
jgi:hypothetical protein